MTKKDYELVAKALANQRDNVATRSSIECRILDETIENIAAHFALVNDKFNAERFKEVAAHGESCNVRL